MTPLTPYEQKILTLFAAGFPRSAQYRGGRKMRKGQWNTVFPELENDVEAKENLLLAVERLVSLGVVTASWKRFRTGDELSALYLEDPVKLYELLGEEHPEDLRRGMLGRLEGFLPQTDLQSRLIGFLREQLSVTQPPLLDSAVDLEDILRLAALTRGDREGFSLRALSVRMFNDSKRIESILPLADRLMEQAGVLSLSVELRLSRSYPETAFSGFCRFQLDNHREWELAGDVLILPLQMCRRIRGISWNRKGNKTPRVLSLENKESFYVAREALKEFDGFLYTSGHPNSADQLFLQLILDSKAELFHFGDLDPEGLLIFQEIHGLTAGRVTPFLMNEAVYLRYLSHGYVLSEDARRKAERVRIPELLPLARRIQKEGRGVEQEVISLESSSPSGIKPIS